MKRSYSWLALIAVLQAGLVEASVQQLTPVEVRAARTLSGDVLNREGLRAARAGNLDSYTLMSAASPALQAFAGGPASALPYMRGLADERLRLTIDGADLYAACPNHMNTPLSYLSPQELGEVRIYPSLLPVSEGGDALGGGIIVERRKPAFAAQPGELLREGEIALYGHSNGNGRIGEVLGRVATDQFVAQYMGSVAARDNYRAGGPFKSYRFTGREGHSLDEDRVGSSAFLLRNHALDLGWRQGGHEWRAELSYQQQPYQLYPNQRMDMLENEAKRLQLSYRTRLAWGAVEARVYHEAVDHFMDFGQDKRFWYGQQSGGPTALSARPCSPIGPNCAAGMPMYTASETHGAKVQAEIERSNSELVRLGLEWNRFALDDWWPPSGASMWPGTFWNIRDGVRSRVGAFAEWQKALTPSWQTTLGLRVERVRVEAGAVQGYADTDGAGAMANFQRRDAQAFNALDKNRAATTWNLVWSNQVELSPKLQASFDLGRQERFASLYELFPWSTWRMAAFMNNFTGDGHGYIGNPLLKPEVAYTFATRLIWSGDHGWRLEWRPYVSYVEDYIDAVQWDAARHAPASSPVRRNFVVLRYTNQDAKLFGHELLVSSPELRASSGIWRLQAALSCTRGENRETGEPLYGIMPRTLRVVLNHQLQRFAHQITLEAVERKTRVNRMRNEIETGGYALVHWNARYELSKALLFEGGVDNLFDRKYAHPLAGAYVGQGTTMSVPPLPNQPQWGTPVPGMGRNVWVGLRVRF